MTPTTMTTTTTRQARRGHARAMRRAAAAAPGLPSGPPSRASSATSRSSAPTLIRWWRFCRDASSRRTSRRTSALRSVSLCARRCWARASRASGRCARRCAVRLRRRSRVSSRLRVASTCSLPPPPARPRAGRTLSPSSASTAWASRRRSPRWRTISSRTDSRLCSARATPSAPEPSSSCASTPTRWSCRSSRRGMAVTHLASRPTASSTRSRWATTWC
mmetsp:Transcript_31878/g.83364  ORF Transcript_31878/g.83364 Transcript_31878/m.83364 type:complete len:219 (-) Transcript_31878:1128-1784(-)